MKFKDDNERLDYVNALRKIADTVEKHPDVVAPYIGTVIFQAFTKQQIIDIINTYGGRWEKDIKDCDYTLTQSLGSNLRLYVFINRDKVCHKVVVGKKLIPERIIPATEETVIPEHEEEIVQWDCPDSIMEG